MEDNRTKQHRRSIRLKGYDYTQTGAYFVTLCTHNRPCLFGTVVDGEMQLNDAGEMVEHWWFELKQKFATVETDEFLIMPNHCHSIVIITDAVVGADLRVSPVSEGAHTGAPLRPRLSTVIQWFKTITTNHYIRGVKTGAWARFIWTLMATQLLRTRHPQRRIIEPDKAVHPGQPGAMGIRP
jgi:REP-associated tyrosine transposase